MTIIGTEEHISFGAIVDEIKSALPADDPTLRLATSPAMARYPSVAQVVRRLDAAHLPERLADMAAAGVRTQLLSFAGMLNSAHVGVHDRAHGTRIARGINDALAAVVRAHPRQFRALAELPLHSVPDALEELERIASQRDVFKGVLVNGSVASSALGLDHPQFHPLLAALERLRLPLFMHPGAPPPAVRDAYYAHIPHTPSNSSDPSAAGTTDSDTASAYSSLQLSLAGWGWHVDAGTQILRLILAGTFDRFPALKLATGHCGELLPAMAARSDTMFAPADTGLKRSVRAVLHENVWVSVSGVFDEAVVRLAIAALGADRVMFGADYPFIDPAGISPFVDALRREYGDADVDKVLVGNARVCFCLDDDDGSDRS